MAKIRYEDFADRSKDAFFPFVKSNPQNRSQDFELPSSVILDAAMHIPGSTGYYSLTTMTSLGDRLVFEVRSSDGGTAMGEWVMSQPNLSCVDLLTASQQHAGMLLLSTREAAKLLNELPAGTYTFEESSAIFAPATYHFVPYVDELTTSNGVISVQPDEDIILRGHNGVFLECVDGEIRVHAVGDPRGRRAVCEGTFTPETFIREVVFQHADTTINCQPDNGNVEIRVVSDSGESSLRMRQSGNEISFHLIAPKS